MSTDANAASAGSIEPTRHVARRASTRVALSLLGLVVLVLVLAAAPASAAPQPKPTMLDVTNVGYTSAEGEADLHSSEWRYLFEVSTDGVNWVQQLDIGPEPGPDHIVKGPISNLEPDTHYFVRVASWYLSETNPSANSIEITTLAVDPPEVVSIDDASSVGYTSAHASGKVKRPANADEAFDTSCFFEYVTDEQFTNSGFEGAGQVECEGGPIKAGGEKDVAADLTGLANNTTYHLRLRAANKGGDDSAEAASTFKTLPVTPPTIVAVNPATNVTYSGVLLHAEIERPANPDPAFEINDCEVELVTEEQFQATGFENVQYGFPCPEGISYPPGDTKTVDVQLGRYLGYDTLPTNTTFHVRFRVGTLGGTVREEMPGTFTTLPDPPPPAVTISAPTSVVARGAHIAGTVNAGGTDTLQIVRWRFECTPECPAAGGSNASGEIQPPEDAVIPVEADLRLKANTSYEIRLIAKNYGGPGYEGVENATAPISFQTPIVINAKTGSATVTRNSAGISGQVDPGGDLTSYHFEYGLDDEYGQSTVSKSLAPSDKLASVSANVTGLEPDTTYHYRLVASNSAGESKGIDRTFTTAEAIAAEETCDNKLARVQQKSTALPECRAYEIVNSPSSEIGDIVRVPQARDDGGAAGWITTTPGKEVSGNILVSTGIGRRTDSGWVQEDANPRAITPTHALSATIPLQFSSDFSQLLTVTPARNDPADGPETLDFYRLDIGSGGDGTWISRPEGLTGFISFNLAGASDDLSTIYYGYPYATNRIYKTSNGIDREEVSIDVDGQPIEAAPATTGNNVSQIEERNPVSSDGRMIFFNRWDFFGGGPLLLRDTVANKTIEVSASQKPGEVGAVNGGRFLGASPDAEVVYFASTGQLTATATVNGGIYRYNTVTKALDLVTGPVSSGAGIEPSEYQIPLNSKDTFYFTSSHAVAPGAEEGATNVYVVNGTTTSLIASVPATPGVQLARVNRDGRFALLGTKASLDGAPNNERSALYEYDNETGNIACVSCRPNGGKSQGGANLANFPLTYPNCCLSPRNITDDGGVFFASTDQLLPADETASQDIYYYHHGTLSLMTTGKGDKDSYVGENTPDGKTVFIITRLPLVPGDEDAEEQDVYAVRVGGGFYKQPAAGDLCQGEACRTNPSQAPPATAPATPSFIGADNSQSGRNQARKKKKNKGKKNRGKAKKHKAKKGKGKSKNKNKRGKRNGRAGR